MRKEIPLMHTTDMVKAILADRKTETRRTRGLDEINSDPDIYELKCIHTITRSVAGKEYPNPISTFAIFIHPFWFEDTVKCPYGNVGDLIWVRETFAKPLPDHIKIGKVYVYKADENRGKNYKWKPSIHMPKEAARIWLEITDIKIERLQDITNEGAIAEGIEHPTTLEDGKLIFREYTDDDFPGIDSPYLSYANLWQSINGKPKPNKPDLSWPANPWVWVIKYEVISKTGRP